jgi:hypothetical protein
MSLFYTFIFLSLTLGTRVTPISDDEVIIEINGHQQERRNHSFALAISCLQQPCLMSGSVCDYDFACFGCCYLFVFFLFFLAIIYILNSLNI